MFARARGGDSQDTEEEGEVRTSLGIGVLDVHQQDCRCDVMSVDSRKGNFGSEVGEEEGIV
jgi:hypothetical protein